MPVHASSRVQARTGESAQLPQQEQQKDQSEQQQSALSSGPRLSQGVQPERPQDTPDPISVFPPSDNDWCPTSQSRTPLSSRRAMHLQRVWSPQFLGLISFGLVCVVPHCTAPRGSAETKCHSWHATGKGSRQMGSKGSSVLLVMSRDNCSMT